MPETPPPFLPYGRQTIEDDDVAAVAAALRADFLTTGPTVEASRAPSKPRSGPKHAIAVANGTATLHLAMLALGVGEGDVCIAPSVTFLATANCARYVGAEVVFADVDPDSGLMTPDTLGEAMTRAEGRRVKAVLPVHLRGDVCDLPGLKALADGVGAVLVEDAPTPWARWPPSTAWPIRSATAPIPVSPASRSTRSRPWPPARAA